MTRLVDGYDVALLDLDGTVYVGPRPVEYAVESLNSVAQLGMRLVYTTNNAARTPSEVATQLRQLGLTLDDTDVLTSAQVAAHHIAATLGAGALVLPVGGPGVTAALLKAGLTVATSAEQAPVAVMQGYGPDVSWRDLAEAAYAIAGGAEHFATNTDLSIPTARGIAPGNGALVAAVVQATRVQPHVTGKPFRPMFDLAVELTQARNALVIGDRLDTDIEGGFNSGLDTLFVFTGVDGVAELLAAAPARRPTHIARDLRALFRTPGTTQSLDSGFVECGGWRVAPNAAVVERGADEVDGVRAMAQVVWALIDSGVDVAVADLARQFPI